MKIARVLACLLLFFCGSSFASPNLWSGGQLLQYYRAYKTTTDSSNSGNLAGFATYLGYIRGAYEILVVSPDAIPCTDNTVTLKDIGEVVGQYMIDHPQQLRLPASFLVRKSLLDAYPCK